MKKMSLSQLLILSSLAAAMALSGCSAKDRDTSFSQGQGENLLQISDYDGKTFEIQTGDVAKTDDNKKVEIKSSDKKISVEDQTSQSLPLVTYTTQAKLLQQVPLRGRTQFKYQALYKVTDNFLKIYQVGNKADIDRDQQATAEVLSDGRLAVPLMGYPIRGFYNVEKIKNGDNEETNKLGEFSKERDGARHFRIDLNGAQVFEAVAKENIMRADYFAGDWYFAATIVEAADSSKLFLGFHPSEEGTSSINRIKFILNESQLAAQDLNVDARLNKKDELNLTKILTMPVQWRDFEVAPKGRDKDLREKEDTTKAWDKRRYVQLNFGQTMAEGSSATGRLTGLEVTDNYFSYTLQAESSSVRVRYSFLRVPLKPAAAYIPKRHFSEDAKKFGFFVVTRGQVQNFEILHKEDVEKNILLQRFNPQAGKIVFHFTKTSPAWAREFARDVVSSWDQAFNSAGTKLRIVLDESFDVELGDIRYNGINLIESLTAADLFGFGPTVVDPLTGEIISATTNLHLTSIQESLAREVKNFVRSELGLMSSKYSEGIGSLLSGISQLGIPDVNAQPAVQAPGVEKALTLKGNYLYAPATIKLPAFAKKMAGGASKIEFRNSVVSSASSPQKRGRDQDLAVTSGNIHEDIRKMCPEISAYVKELKEQKKNYSEKGAALFLACARKMVGPKAQATLIHEMGHNFGLRHNFMGSVDKGNFWGADITKTNKQVPSSSVMEYPAFNDDRLAMTGPYDIAAIRYGYADAVLLSDNKSVLKLDTNKTIAENLGNSAERKQMRPYLFCTDEDVTRGAQAMCDRWDSGTTPTEIVNNLIQQYHTSLALLNYRYDAPKTWNNLDLTTYRIQRIMIPMTRIYQQWRLQLARFVGNNHRYLQDLDREAYDLVLKKMEADPQFKEIYQSYKPAVDHIYAFFKMIATLENRYCVVQDKTGIQGLLELEGLRSEAYRSSQVSTKSCNDPAIADVLDISDLKVIGQGGHFLNSLRFDLNPEKVSDPLDVIGSQLDRWAAAEFLTDREAYSSVASEQNFNPSMMDEPNYRHDWMTTLENRVIQGVSTIRLKKDVQEATKLPDFAPLFKSETDLIASQFALLSDSLRVPGDMTETHKRRATYESATSAVSGGTEAPATSELGRGQHFVVEKAYATFAILLSNKYEDLRLDLDTVVKIEDMAAAMSFIDKNFPSQDELNKMTVEQFQKLFAETISLKFPTVSALKLWYRFTKSERKMLTKIEENQKDKDFLATSAKALFEASNLPFEFTKENYSQRLKETVDKTKKDLIARQATLDQEQAESNAQMDLIKRVMIQIAD